MMIVISVIALVVSMVMVLIRGMIGPTSFDRMLAANSFGTLTVVVIALMGEIQGTAFYLDVALTYALINFVATIAFLRFSKVGSFGGDQ